MYQSPEYQALISVAQTYADMNEGNRHRDEKARAATGDGGVRQGKRLPMKNFQPMKRASQGQAAASDSKTNAPKGTGRTKNTVSGKPFKGAFKGASEKNQAQGGTSEQQYQPKKFRKIKSQLQLAKDSGIGPHQIGVKGKPPYEPQHKKSDGPPPQKVRGAQKMKDWKPSESDMKAIEKMGKDSEDRKTLNKRQLEASAKAKPKRERVKMKKQDRPGIIKKK